MKQINYNSLVAKTFEGLEPLLAKEIEALGGENVRISRRAVKFSGDLELVYKANLNLRTALRILINVHQFRFETEDRLYKKVQDINWLELISPDMTFAIDSIVTDSEIFRHTNYASLKTKDAIVDQIRDKLGMRPNVDSDNPDVRINVRILENECIISLDTSGDSLHRRGYRVFGGKAPLNEVLAASMIMLTGWDGSTPLFNPMCGSSTLMVEAAMIAGNMAPGRQRQFGFMNWKNFDRLLWKKVKKQARDNRREITVPIYGCDIDENQLSISCKNIEAARLDEDIVVNSKDFFTMPNNAKVPPLIVINPPYDLRLDNENVDDFYRLTGDTLKQRYADSDAWIVSANMSAISSVGLRADKKFRLYNGQLECSYRKYELYEGTIEEEKIDTNTDGNSDVQTENVLNTEVETILENEGMKSSLGTYLENSSSEDTNIEEVSPEITD